MSVLPPDVLHNIFEYVDLRSFVRVRQVCRIWRSVASHRSLELLHVTQALQRVEDSCNGGGDRYDSFLRNIDISNAHSYFFAILKLLMVNQDFEIDSNVTMGFQRCDMSSLSQSVRLIVHPDDQDAFKVYNLCSNPPRLEAQFALTRAELNIEPIWVPYMFAMSADNSNLLIYLNRQIRVYEYYETSSLGPLIYSTDDILEENEWIDYVTLRSNAMLVKSKQGTCILVNITTDERVHLNPLFTGAENLGPGQANNPNRGPLTHRSMEVAFTHEEHRITVIVSVHPFSNTNVYTASTESLSSSPMLPFFGSDGCVFSQVKDLLHNGLARIEIPLRGVLPLSATYYFGLSADDATLNIPCICKVVDDRLISLQQLPPAYFPSMCVSPDGRLLAIAGPDAGIYLYNVSEAALDAAFACNIPLPFRLLPYDHNSVPGNMMFISRAKLLAEFRISSDIDSYSLFRTYDLNAQLNYMPSGGRNWDVAQCGHVQEGRYHKPHRTGVVTEVGKDIWGLVTGRLPCRHKMWFYH